MEQPKEEKKECNCTGPWDCQCPDILKSFYGIREENSGEKEEPMKWVSVKDRLPDENTFDVLVKVDEPFFGMRTPKQLVAYYSNEDSIWKCELTSREVYHVTHWMPLPEPPKQ